MGCGGSVSSKQTPVTRPEAHPQPPNASKPAAKPAAGGDPDFIAQLKTLETPLFVRLIVGKDKPHYGALSVDGKAMELCFANGTTGDVYQVTLSETELTSKRGQQPWATFFKILKSNFKKATVKESNPSETFTLQIPGEGKAVISFALKARARDVATLHRLILNPLVAGYTKAKAGDDSKSTKLEIELNGKKASIAENEQKVAALQVEIEPLSASSKQAQEDARAAKEQCDGVRKRIRKLKNFDNKERDHLYPDGPAVFLLHTPHAKEHVPIPIPINRHAMHLIKEKYGGDTSTAPTELLNQNHDEIIKILSKIDEWEYDVFALQKETHGGSLFMTSYCLLYKYGLVKQFNIDEQILVNFLQAVESGYHPNPYHNSTHAADVLQITHYIMEPGGLKQVIGMTQNDCLAALLSACIHDYDHPGFNNNFHIRTGAYLAGLYNDRSILESHHLAQVFDLVKNPKFNIFASLSWEQFKDVRDTMLEMVLSTDMGLHAKIYQTFRRRLNEDKEWQTREDQRLALSIAIKMADISNCCRPSHLYTQWAKNIAAEFYNQGDAEARLGFTISPFMDRRKDKMDFPKGQVSFMNYIVVPLFEAGAQLLPKMQFTVDEAKKNKADLLNLSPS